MNDLDNKIIYTKRLVLREISEDDTDIIVEWRTNPSTYKYFKNPHALSIEEHSNWFNNVYLKSRDMVSWMCCFQQEKIGVFSIARKKEKYVEISYLLSTEYQGRGFAKEAVNAIEQWAIGHWNVEYSLAEIHKDNKNSIKFAESMGYLRESDFDIYKKKINDNEI